MAGKVINATVLAALVVVAMSMSVMITTEASRLDLSSILRYIGGIDNEESTTSIAATATTTTASACCDTCFCTRSIPPQCQCADIKTYCHSDCKSCRCTRSIPPQCRCMDIDDFCYPPCPYSTKNDAAAINGGIIAN